MVEVEAADDPTPRIARDIVLEDAPDNCCFRFVHDQVRRYGAGAGHPAIAIRGFPEDYFATAGTPEFATPLTFGDLRALILSDYASDLGQQPGLRIIIERRRIAKQRTHAVQLELLEHNHLIAIHVG